MSYGAGDTDSALNPGVKPPATTSEFTVVLACGPKDKSPALPRVSAGWESLW